MPDDKARTQDANDEPTGLDMTDLEQTDLDRVAGGTVPKLGEKSCAGAKGCGGTP